MDGGQTLPTIDRLLPDKIIQSNLFSQAQSTAMSTAGLKLFKLQAKLQLQLEQLKKDHLAKIIIPHGVTIHSGEAVTLPQFSLGKAKPSSNLRDFLVPVST